MIEAQEYSVRIKGVTAGPIVIVADDASRDPQGFLVFTRGGKKVAEFVLTEVQGWYLKDQ